MLKLSTVVSMMLGTDKCLMLYQIELNPQTVENRNHGG